MPKIPIIGLTATPFRGRNAEETERLAKRFCRNLIPPADRQPHLYRELLAQGILSSVEPNTIDYTSTETRDFTSDEKKHFERFQEISDTVLITLTNDPNRNDRIVNQIHDLTAAGPVLLFANSVAHSQYLSARLCVEGIPAASIHGETETTVRQHFIREFQAEKIKVLVNYQVLTTGFDAPKTSAILISRPVFSPVRFMQMIGRGLRGPKNGGTATCKLITVIDNLLEHFENPDQGIMLGYHHFIKYYNKN